MSDTTSNSETKKTQVHEPTPETVETFEAIQPDFSLPAIPDTPVDPALDAPLTDAPLTDVPNFDAPLPEKVEAESSTSSPADFLDEVRSYSESLQGTTSMVEIFVPYHLYLSGTFGPYERDKLLLFITENEIGLTSQELDLQIQSGKVFFPRISEFAGIKLIQELRDSGLQIRFHPSDFYSGRDADETRQVSEGVSFHFDAVSGGVSPSHEVRILSADSAELTRYQELETITSTQYLRANMVEVESSDLFQDLLERMTESIKHRARIKGADAVAKLQHHLSPLRLPSQYQVTLQAVLLKRK